MKRREARPDGTLSPIVPRPNGTLTPVVPRLVVQCLAWARVAPDGSSLLLSKLHIGIRTVPPNCEFIYYTLLDHQRIYVIRRRIS